MSSAMSKWASAESPRKATTRPPRGRVVADQTNRDVNMKPKRSGDLRVGVLPVKPRACPPSPAQLGAQGACLGAADGHLARGVVAHRQLVATAEPRDDLLHVAEVDEARLVHAEEQL